MSSDSHSDDHGHVSHDSHAHPVATDVIFDTSWQDWLLKGVTVVTAGLLYFMAFCWMGVPLPEADHEAGTGSEFGLEHAEQHGTAEHSEEHH